MLPLCNKYIWNFSIYFTVCSVLQDTYYVAPKSEQNSTGHAKGKLPNAVRNVKARMKIFGETSSFQESEGSEDLEQPLQPSSLKKILETREST